MIFLAKKTRKIISKSLKSVHGPDTAWAGVCAETTGDTFFIV